MTGRVKEAIRIRLSTLKSSGSDCDPVLLVTFELFVVVAPEKVYERYSLILLDDVSSDCWFSHSS